MQVFGPSWHGFTDAAHFVPVVRGAGRRLDRGDPLLAGLRQACGETEWAEGGFADPDGVIYRVQEYGYLAAAGNLTPFRGSAADVGLLTRPAARGRGLAKQVAGQMVAGALPAAGIIRYRALVTNSPPLAIARSLGFVGYGQNRIARLPAFSGSGGGDHGLDVPGADQLDAHAGEVAGVTGGYGHAAGCRNCGDHRVDRLADLTANSLPGCHDRRQRASGLLVVAAAALPAAGDQALDVDSEDVLASAVGQER